MPSPNVKKTHCLVIKDINCAACVNIIENTLLSLSEVLDARVNPAKRLVFIDCFVGTSSELFVEALSDIGYEVKAIVDKAT